MKPLPLVILLFQIFAIENSFASDITTHSRVDQGWTTPQITAAYTTYEGSQIMPARWFLALERSNSKKNLSETLENFGFIYDGNDKIPLGVVFQEDDITSTLYNEKRWVGINCAVCHTSQMTVNGRSLIIEGGSNQFDIHAFEKEIVLSVDATLGNAEKWIRFVKAVGDTINVEQAENLKKNLILFRDEFKNWSDQNHTYKNDEGQILQYGPSRMDGLGGPTNDLTCQLTPRLGDQTLAQAHNKPENCRTSHAPSTIPHLWGMTENLWVQWNGNVHSSLGRNWGQSTGTYGKNWIERDKNGKVRFRSTSNLDGLYKFENLYHHLKSPAWKDIAQQGLLPDLEQNKVVAGQKIYAAKCLNCHAVQPEFTKPNKFRNSYWQIPVYEPQAIGTDTFYLQDTTQRTSKLPTDYTKDFQASFGSNSVDSEQNVNSSFYRSFVIRKMIVDAFQMNEFSLEKMALYTNCRDSSIVQPALGLKSRSLEGVGFTAPYLHNGSVESLYELLLPASKRKKQFLVGCRKYDIKKMGYDCTPYDKNIFTFQTAQRGNSNAGHEFGTDLTDGERYELIEYLKSLTQPLGAPKNPDCH